MSKILVIDDDINTTLLISNILSREGYEIYSINDSSEALSTALSIEPDLILLDLIMPGTDGIGTCEILNSNPELKQIPILVFSAVGDIKSKLAAFNAGAKDYITKPVHIEELKSRVKLWTKSREGK